MTCDDVEPLLLAIASAAGGESLFAHLGSDQLLQALARAQAARDGFGSGPDRRSLTIDLTSREQAVLDLMSRGLGNKEIAQALNLAECTLKNHVAAVLAKLGIPDRMKAVLFAVTHGLVRPPVGRKA